MEKQIREIKNERKYEFEKLDINITKTNSKLRLKNRKK